MKMTESNDGILRATVRVEYRITEEDRRVIAFVNDKMKNYDHTGKTRLASRDEVVDALKNGYYSDAEWRDEYVSQFYGRYIHERYFLR